MESFINKNIGAVVLAAGKGTRLNAVTEPKVMLPIGGRPIVSYTVDTLKKAGFEKPRLCLVVGFKKESVQNFFVDTVTYANQDKQLGTAHAAYVGMSALPPEVTTVLVMGGDDSAFYSADTFINFVTEHLNSGATVSVLTTVVKDPNLLGRVVRDSAGNLLGVYEKEQINQAQASITEISTGTYCLDRAWYQTAFPSIPNVNGLNELGLNNVLKLARQEDKKIQAVKLANPGEWFGINTPQELLEADRRKK